MDSSFDAGINKGLSVRGAPTFFFFAFSVAKRSGAGSAASLAFTPAITSGSDHALVFEGRPCYLGLRIEGLRFRVQGLGFRFENLMSRVDGLGFRVWGVGFRV